MIVARTKKNIGQSEIVVSFIGTRTWSGIGTIVHKVTWPWRQEKAGFPTLARSKRGDIHRRSFGMLRCFTASLFLLFFPSLFFLHSDAPFPVISSTRRYLHTLYLFKIPFLEIKRPSRIIIFQRTLQHGCFYFIIRLKFPDSSIYSRISTNFVNIEKSIFESCRENNDPFDQRNGSIVKDNSVVVPIYFPVDRTWSRATARETLKKTRIREENEIPRVDPEWRSDT